MGFLSVFLEIKKSKFHVIFNLGFLIFDYLVQGGVVIRSYKWVVIRSDKWVVIRSVSRWISACGAL